MVLLSCVITQPDVQGLATAAGRCTCIEYACEAMRRGAHHVQDPSDSHGVVSTQKLCLEDETSMSPPSPSYKGVVAAAGRCTCTQKPEQAHGDAGWLSDSHDVVSTQRFSSERWCFIMYHHTAIGPQGLPLQEVSAPAVCMHLQCVCTCSGLVCTNAHHSAPKLSASHDVGLNRGIQLRKMVFVSWHHHTAGAQQHEEAAHSFACPMLICKTSARHSS